MTLIEQVEQAFGPPEEDRVLNFMVDQELTAATILPGGSVCLKSVSVGGKHISCGRRVPISTV